MKRKNSKAGALVAWAALVATLVAAPAFAKSTTGTTLATEGSPVQGKQITIVVNVTGSHLVYGGRGTVFGGYIGIYAQGANVYREMPNVVNTPVTKVVECGVYDPQSGCYTVLFGQVTTIRLPYVVPKGVSQLQLTANFEGDNESHGSGATPLSVPTIGVGVDPSIVLDLLMDD
jgi:hypothetical protein